MRLPVRRLSRARTTPARYLLPLVPQSCHTRPTTETGRLQRDAPKGAMIAGMARWFVFVDTDYYPYVDDVVEADTREEALQKVTPPHPGERVYVAREEDVTVLDGGEVPRQPTGDTFKAILALQDSANRTRSEVIAWAEAQRQLDPYAPKEADHHD